MATQDTTDQSVAPVVGPDDPRRFTDSGIEVQTVYGPDDLPTQLGLDSDDPRCLGEVGRTGVAIDTVDDMRTAFDGIPLDEVSTSMTINAPAAVLLLLYQLVGEEQGVPSGKLRGTTQNDVLKEYI